MKTNLTPGEGPDGAPWGGEIMAGEKTLGTALGLTSRFPRLNPSAGLNLAAEEITSR